ncbi:hypothetical protein HSBAA_09410 [Vreelandella sulfidaeris]|uniref:Uncharacterized protein n=1 Tax=Vreelandella sulfidaeris TaxID=115553 RepID=A0A455U1G4_9GAMM|nr:hypothetical protein HSBAA_09410 [Halomonas sulfidaeris]
MAGAFQAAHAGGANRDHALTRRQGVAHLLAGGFRDLNPLAVHMVFKDVVDAHRLKGARTYVQGDKGTVNAFISQRIQQRLIKMQPCGGAATAPSRRA